MKMTATTELQDLTSDKWHMATNIEELNLKEWRWTKKATEQISATCCGEESYKPDGLSEAAILPDEIECLISTYLHEIKTALYTYYHSGRSSVSDNRREMHAWKRIATFLHSNLITKNRLREIFWMSVIRSDHSAVEARISVFNEMTFFLDKMGIYGLSTSEEYQQYVDDMLG